MIVYRGMDRCWHAPTSCAWRSWRKINFFNSHILLSQCSLQKAGVCKHCVGLLIPKILADHRFAETHASLWRVSTKPASCLVSWHSRVSGVHQKPRWGLDILIPFCLKSYTLLQFLSWSRSLQQLTRPPATLRRDPPLCNAPFLIPHSSCPGSVLSDSMGQCNHSHIVEMQRHTLFAFNERSSVSLAGTSAAQQSLQLVGGHCWNTYLVESPVNGSNGSWSKIQCMVVVPFI